MEPYYPSSLHCYHCQKFGHSSKICKVTTSICGKCNKPGHKYSDCTNTEIKCANCKGPHTAADKKCPRYKKEMEISRLKTDQNISFQQARNIVLSNRAETILGHNNDHHSQLNFRTNAHIGLGSLPQISKPMQRICNCQQLHEQKEMDLET